MERTYDASLFSAGQYDLCVLCIALTSLVGHCMQQDKAFRALKARHDAHTSAVELVCNFPTRTAGGLGTSVLDHPSPLSHRGEDPETTGAT